MLNGNDGSDICKDRVHSCKKKKYWVFRVYVVFGSFLILLRASTVHFPRLAIIAHTSIRFWLSRQSSFTQVSTPGSSDKSPTVSVRSSFFYTHSWIYRQSITAYVHSSFCYPHSSWLHRQSLSVSYTSFLIPSTPGSTIAVAYCLRPLQLLLHPLLATQAVFISFIHSIFDSINSWLHKQSPTYCLRPLQLLLHPFLATQAVDLLSTSTPVSVTSTPSYTGC